MVVHLGASALECQDHARGSNDGCYCRQSLRMFRAQWLRLAPTRYVPKRSFLARYRHCTPEGFPTKRLAGAAGFPSFLADALGVFYC